MNFFIIFLAVKRIKLHKNQFLFLGPYVRELLLGFLVKDDFDFVLVLCLLVVKLTPKLLFVLCPFVKVFIGITVNLFSRMFGYIIFSTLD